MTSARLPGYEIRLEKNLRLGSILKRPFGRLRRFLRSVRRSDADSSDTCSLFRKVPGRNRLRGTKNTSTNVDVMVVIRLIIVA